MNDAAEHARSVLNAFESFVGELDHDALSITMPNGWTVAATLAHVAFYDDWVRERWTRRLRDGAFQDLPDDITDIVNAAGARIWDAVDPVRARTAALAAARAVAGLIETLPAAVVEDAIRTGRPAMVDRARHYDEHVEAIRASLR